MERNVPDNLPPTPSWQAARAYLTLEVACMWLALAAMIFVNAWFEITQFGGQTAASVSGIRFTWFMPAGYVFSIWTLIYLGLIAWLVDYTRRAPQRPRAFGFTALLFIVSCILNMLWLAVWHYLLIDVALVELFALWLVLVVLYHRVRRPPELGRAVPWLQRAPISLYLAWASIALVANFCVLVTWLLDGSWYWPNFLSTLALAAGALSAGYAMQDKLGDGIFQLVALWAVIGIAVHVWPAAPVLGVLLLAMSCVAAAATFYRRTRR